MTCTSGHSPIHEHITLFFFVVVHKSAHSALWVDIVSIDSGYNKNNTRPTSTPFDCNGDIENQIKVVFFFLFLRLGYIDFLLFFLLQ